MSIFMAIDAVNAVSKQARAPVLDATTSRVTSPLLSPTATGAIWTLRKLLAATLNRKRLTSSGVGSTASTHPPEPNGLRRRAGEDAAVGTEIDESAARGKPADNLLDFTQAPWRRRRATRSRSSCRLCAAGS